MINVIQAFFDAANYLDVKFGRKPEANWQWGRLHRHHFIHNPFTKVPFLKDIYERSYAAPGWFKFLID